MKNFLKYVMLFCSLLLAVLLLFCNTIPNTNPYELSFAGILSFFAPVFAVLNLFFLFVWLIFKKFKYSLIPLVALILSWNIYASIFALNLFKKQSIETNLNRINVMSYNVRLLNLYNWNKEPDTRKKIIKMFAKYSPTVLCLQEFYNGNDSVGFNNIQEIMESCGYKYFATCDIFSTKRGKWGNVVFSHLPIIKKQNHDIDVYGNNLLQQVDILWKNQTIHIFNVHLKSNRFTSNESDAINNPEKNQLKENSLNIFKKLRKNAINRGLEASLVAKILSNTKENVIVCGDLNDIPSSYVYFKVKNKLKDTFLENGLGMGTTYISKIPILRIDYIFHSKHFKCMGYKRFNYEYSDHYPIMVNLEM